MDDPCDGPLEYQIISEDEVEESVQLDFHTDHSYSTPKKTKRNKPTSSGDENARKESASRKKKKKLLSVEELHHRIYNEAENEYDKFKELCTFYYGNVDVDIIIAEMVVETWTRT